MKKMRRSFIINRPFQFRFSLYVCSWLFALSLLYPWVIYDVFNAFFTYLSRFPNGPDSSKLETFRTNTVWMLVVSHSVFMGVTFAISVFLSHRIAGPIYKLQQYMERVKSGDLNGVLFFRRADHFQEVASGFNEMIESMRTRMEKAETALKEASETADPETKKRIQKALDHVSTHSAS